MTLPDIREGGPEAAQARLADALDDPQGHAAMLAAVLNDRGLRDGLLITAAAGDRWQELADAARAGGLYAAVTDEASVYGPLTVLVAADWVLGDPQAPQRLAVVPDTDPAYRLATLLRWAADAGLAPTGWVQGIAAVPVAEALAFEPHRPWSTSAAGGADPLAADREPPPPPPLDGISR